MLIKKNYCILLLLLTYAIQAGAVSAFPKPVKITQPDGSTITVILKGDEHLHWMETKDSITLMQNSKGYITYATTDAKGNMVASEVIAQDVANRPTKVKSLLATQTQKVFFSQAQLDSVSVKAKVSAVKSQKSAALPTGTKKILVILMGYKDLAFTKTVTEFDNQYNLSGYSANKNQSSVKEYFTANSYSNFTYSFDVKGPYTASRNMSYYGGNDASGYDQHPDSLVVEAIRAVHSAYSSLDFSQYVAVSVVFAGYGEEAGASSNTIWSNQSDFTPPSYCSISHYIETPELYGNAGSMVNTIGVTCHELNHVIGAPDYYDVDYNYYKNGYFTGTGEWDIMASGSWNYISSTDSAGTCPANLTLYQKYRYGWITPTVLYYPTSISGMTSSSTKGEAYLVQTPTHGEYYFLENRQQTGYDTALPGHGLLIYHIAEYADDLFYYLNNTAPQKVYPVCASATTNPASSYASSSSVTSYGSIDSGGCPFPGTSSKTSFTDSTTPSAKAWNKSSTDKPITNITEDTSTGTISFDFMKNIDVAPTPLNLKGKLSGVNYTLSWTAPSSIPLIKDTIVEKHWDGAALEIPYGYDFTTLSCMQLYSAASLTNYVGKNWTGIKFIPYDSKASNYTIQLFNMTSGSIVASRSITGVTNDQWNEFSFTTPITIQSNIAYGIGVQYSSPNGYTLSVDRGPKIQTTDSNGNATNSGALIYTNSTFYTLSDVDNNFNVRGLISDPSSTRYNIYFNGDSIGQTASLAYTVDANQAKKSGTYCVRTVNNGVVGRESACLDYSAPIFASPTIFYSKDNNSLIFAGFSTGNTIRVYSITGKLIDSFVFNESWKLRWYQPNTWLIVKSDTVSQKVIIPGGTQSQDLYFLH
jgi:M6 family metalloprotease-like protein